MEIFALYESVVARLMNSKHGRVVADVGGGKSCPFVHYREPDSDAKIIAVDISDEEMRHNRDVDEMRTANIMKELPFEDCEVDMVVSRSVLEHLEDLESFVANSGRVLKSGGHFVHLFPCRFAPFALINRALPQKVSQKVLYFFMPESKGICGFPAFYDRCYPSRLERMLRRNGFEVIETRVSYYQSSYFSFFVPLYFVSAAYEFLVRGIGVRDLCAYVLIVARKV